MKKALITGIGGFVGSHLADFLLSQGIEVYGLTHPSHHSKTLDKRVKVTNCDLLKKNQLSQYLKSKIIDFIFHLAAFSSPPQSFINPKKTLENNILSQLNLLEVLKDQKSKSKILIISSSDIYGDVDEKYIPVDESAPFLPNSPYAVSKVAQDMLGLQFYLHDKLNIIRVRPFNHIGPGQSKSFVVPSFAAQIASIEKKGEGEVRVGNLESWRDFTDVRDVARAYYLALEKGKIGDVYNIGSSKAYKIADVLESLISLSTAKVNIINDDKLTRIEDVKKISCNYSKFNRDTGWNPQIPISKTLSDTIKYERNLIN